MHIVDTVARKIKPEAFRSLYFTPDDPDLEEIKRRHARSTALVKATRVLKIAAQERQCAEAEIVRELCPPNFFDGQWICSDPNMQAHMEEYRRGTIETAEKLAREIYRLALKTPKLRQQLFDL